MIRIKLTKKVEVMDEILKYTVTSDSGYRLLNNKAHLLVELRELSNEDADPYTKFQLKETSRLASTSRGRKRTTEDPREPLSLNITINGKSIEATRRRLNSYKIDATSILGATSTSSTT